MTFEQIITLLREFNYEKNGLSSTMKFFDHIYFALVDLVYREKQGEDDGSTRTNQ